MRSRWIQLLLGLLCMIVISSPQYVWTLFTQPLMGSLHASLAQIQITFSLLIVVQTFLSPCQGFVVDKFGRRADGTELGARCTSVHNRRFVPHLRAARWNRHRHCLHWRHRSHGAMVSR